MGVVPNVSTHPLALDDIETFVALGHTFPSHRQYSQTPNWPILWTVPQCSIVPENEAINIPSYVDQVVPGAELAVVIGERIWQCSRDEAREAIEGFTISNDVSIKGEFPGYPYGGEQAHRIGRGFHILPSFSPTLSEYTPLKPSEAENLSIEIRIDGKSIFSGSTESMDWPIVDIVRHVSSIVELFSGDVISLGDASDPTTYLESADTVECEIEKIGTLSNPIEFVDGSYDPALI